MSCLFLEFSKESFQITVDAIKLTETPERERVDEGDDCISCSQFKLFVCAGLGTHTRTCRRQRGNCGNQFSPWVVMRIRSPGSEASTPTPKTCLLSYQQFLFTDKERIKFFCSPLCGPLASDHHMTVPLY